MITLSLPRRPLGSLVLILASVGCGAVAKREPATAALAMHVQALAGASMGEECKAAASGGAGLGVEFPDCCGIGAFALSTYRDVGEDADGPASVAAGGLELSAHVPFAPFLLLAGRIGRAGTRPASNGSTSSGYLTGVSLSWPVVEPEALHVAASQSLFHLVLAYDAWQLKGYTPAGANGYENDGHAVMLGVRFGARYGLDLE